MIGFANGGLRLIKKIFIINTSIIEYVNNRGVVMLYSYLVLLFGNNSGVGFDMLRGSRV